MLLLKRYIKLFLEFIILNYTNIIVDYTFWLFSIMDYRNI